MAFDGRTGSVWAVETAPPRCIEGLYHETIGVFSRDYEGEWQGIEKSLFQTGVDDTCSGAFSSIAVMPDGDSGAAWRARSHLPGGYSPSILTLRQHGAEDKPRFPAC